MKGYSHKEIEPTRALRIMSMPCEEKAAHILSKTREAIDSSNLPEAQYRYLQSSVGWKASIFEVVIFGGTAMFSLWIACHYYMRLQQCSDADKAFVLCLLHTLPGLENTKTYAEAQTIAEKHLRKELGDKKFEDFRRKADYAKMKQEFSGRARL